MNEKNLWQPLTAPGQGVIQVVFIYNLEDSVYNGLERLLESSNRKSSSIFLTQLSDLKGEILDEILCEKGSGWMRWHLHGGSVIFDRVKELLASLGCQFREQKIESNLTAEILQALQESKTTKASQKFLENLNCLPTIPSPYEDVLATYEYGQSLVQSHYYYLVGDANAGKSSLINRALGHERVVVSRQAGTTRDLIEVFFEISDREVILVDGAGIRETSNFIETIGQEKLLQSAQCQKTFWVVNPHRKRNPCPVENPIAVILTHQDLGITKDFEFDGPILRTQLGDGASEIKNFISNDLPQTCSCPIIFNRRQKACLQKATRSGSLEQDNWLGNDEFPHF